jgi:hypothetical protein
MTLEQIMEWCLENEITLIFYRNKQGEKLVCFEYGPYQLAYGEDILLVAEEAMKEKETIPPVAMIYEIEGDVKHV